MQIEGIGTNWEYTEKGIKNLKRNDNTRISQFVLRKGQTIKLGFNALSKPAKDTSFIFYVESIQNNTISFTNINNFNLNQKYERTYTATEDCTLTCRMWGNSSSETFEFQLWAEYNELTDYTKHEEESYVLYIQKEMLQKDYFVKEADGWKEVHAYGKSIITENADIVLSSATVDYIEFRINNALTPFSANNYLNTYSNLFSNKANNRCTSYNNYLLCRVPADLKITTVEEFKEILQENNLVVYYKLAAQVKLACTEEQSAVLEELNNLDLFSGVNNIITAEDIALLKLKYALDVETYVDNKLEEKLANINQQILEIVGGN